MPGLVIRADASVRMGTGHLMRMLALAQAYAAQDGNVVFAVAEAPAAVEARLRSEGFAIRRIDAPAGTLSDAVQTAEFARGEHARWVVVDGYQFGTDFQLALKERGVQLLFVDDYGHAGHYYADAVLNQNAYAEPGLYASRERYTKLLLGSRYVLLRREFWPWRERDRQLGRDPRKILLSMGGSDASGVTLSILRAMMAVCQSGTEVLVAIGGANPHRDSLARFAQESPCRIVPYDDAINMADIMKEADLAIASAGTTSWELAFMGVPSLLVVAADNQERVAKALVDNGAAWSLGRAETLDIASMVSKVQALLADSAKLQRMSMSARRLLDGYGVDRACSLVTESGLWLRQVSEGDRELLWRWANDPVTRENSFSSDPIPWETHVRWFDEHVLNGRSLCYIAFTPEDRAVGQARFDDTATGATIGVSVDPQMRGQGYGSRLIRASVRLAIQHRQYERVTAYIKEGNTASLRAFTRAGFHSPTACDMQGWKALALYFDKSDAMRLDGLSGRR